jgi:hypothetical protein
LIKFTILLRRKPTLTRLAFIEHHKTVHADIFMSVAAVKVNVRRYVQQHTLDVALPGMPPAKYDGMTELWFDDVAGIAAVFQDAEYMARVRPDEETFLDLPGCDFLVTTENPVKP